MFGFIVIENSCFLSLARCFVPARLLIYTSLSNCPHMFLIYTLFFDCNYHSFIYISPFKRRNFGMHPKFGMHFFQFFLKIVE